MRTINNWLSQVIRIKIIDEIKTESQYVQPSERTSTILVNHGEGT